jgi:hypothetical protein
MHNCKATIQDYKSAKIRILEIFPEFWDFFSQKWQRFWSKTSNFHCSTKLFLNLFFPKILMQIGSEKLKPM